MKKFMVTYFAPAELMGKMATATDEEKKAGMQGWMDWKASVGDGVLDFGAAFMGGANIAPDGSVKNSSIDLTGYSLIQAEDVEAAKAMLKSHPHLQWGPGCSIEVHECIYMG